MLGSLLIHLELIQHDIRFILLRNDKDFNTDDLQ